MRSLHRRRRFRIPLMTRVRTLKANVTREQAVEQFSASGISKLFRNGFFGPLRSVAEFYVPFRLFRARIVNGGATDENLVALDVVNGTLDLFKFDHIPDDSEIMQPSPRAETFRPLRPNSRVCIKTSIGKNCEKASSD